MSKLFVGNISFNATEEELWDFFKEAGHPPSDLRILTDRETGRSRGYGFVDLVDDSSIERAIEDLNGEQFQGRALTVTRAKPMESNGSRPRNHQPHRSNGRDRQQLNGRGRRESRW